MGLQSVPGPNESLTLMLLSGSPAFESETAVVYEAGARLETRRVFLDLALYQGDYHSLRTLEPTRAGTAFVILQAAAVGMYAEFQLIGLRRSSAPA